MPYLPYLAPSAARGPSKSTVLAGQVGVHVFPGGHDVTLGAVAASASSLLSARARGGREGGAAPPSGLRLHVTPEVSYPSLGKVVPVLNSEDGWIVERRNGSPLPQQVERGGDYPITLAHLLPTSKQSKGGIILIANQVPGRSGSYQV